MTDIKIAFRLLGASFCPIIIPDKIGTIGYTQGVQDKARPARKAAKNRVMPPCSNFLEVIFSESVAVGLSEPVILSAPMVLTLSLST